MEIVNICSMDKKYKTLLANMKDRKNKMTLLYHREKSTEHATCHWDSVYRCLDALLERINVTHLKAQQLQHAARSTDKDTVNLIKMLELIHVILIDFNNISKEQIKKDTQFDDKVSSFEKYMGQVKQQIDLISFEITKLKRVSEALENIVSRY